MLQAWPFRAARSSSVAKERLRAVLVQDRASVSPQLLGQLREAILGAVGPYVDCDRDSAQVSWSRHGDGLALVANIPLRGVRRRGFADT